MRKNVVAVYGTLKRDKSNHQYMNYTDSEFIGNCRTKDKMKLCISGLPYLIKGTSEEGENVRMEAYFVSDMGLKVLDSLEGHPYLYERSILTLIMDDESEINAFVYQVNYKYDNGKYHEEY